MVRRNFRDSVLDGTGLLWQAVAVPAVASLLGMSILPAVFGFPVDKFVISPWILFLLPLTMVDYLYYWNHRLLHGSRFWAFHRVHHSATQLDIWVTSRNSLWTPFLLVYVWFHAFLIFTLHDSSFYVFGMILHGALDLVRHSGIRTPAGLGFLGHIFILPDDHQWHHSRDRYGVNFGANLSLWDRFHGTLYRPGVTPSAIGLEDRGNLRDELLFPWRLKG